MIFLLIWLISVTDFIFDPIFKYLGAVAIPFIGAGVLYYISKPVMHLFERFKINRVVAILLVFLLFLLIGFLFIMYIAPIAQKQFSNLIDNVPKMVKGAQNLWESNQFAIPEQVDEAIDSFTANLQTHIENVMSFLFVLIGQLIIFVAAFILVSFILFFMLKDGNKFIPFITQIFEKKKADNIKRLLNKIDTALTGFIQGQVIVSICVGILLFIGYLILGLDYALTLALFAMLMNVIPFLGPFIAVIPALIVGAFQAPIMILWVAIVTLIAQQIESNFISPNVMGRVLN